MVSYKHKCIYVHIPKTGGSSINHLLLPIKHERKHLIGNYRSRFQPMEWGLQHLRASYILGELGYEIFNKFFKFSFVRNPWDKLVSQYFYTSAVVRHELREWVGITIDSTFEEYITKLYNSNPLVLTHPHWAHQHEFLYDLKGNQMVNFIGKFENFQEDYNQICDILKIERTELPQINKSSPRKEKHYTEFYNDKTRKMVETIYKKDIEIFQYKFGEPN